MANDPENSPPGSLARELFAASNIFSSLAAFEHPTRPIAGLHRTSEPSFRRLAIVMIEARNYIFPGLHEGPSEPAAPTDPDHRPELFDPEHREMPKTPEGGSRKNPTLLEDGKIVESFEDRDPDAPKDDEKPNGEEDDPNAGTDQESGEVDVTTEVENEGQSEGGEEVIESPNPIEGSKS